MSVLFHSLNDDELIAMLRAGAVGVLPTDTVYGLVVSAVNRHGVADLYALKHREGKPGTLIAANTAQFKTLGIDEQYLHQVAHLWPDALSIILPAGPDLAYLHQGLDSLALRVPRDKELVAFLEATGPLLTTSANVRGNPPAATIDQAQAYFGDEASFYVDDGPRHEAMASTIVRLHQDGRLELLRQGPVKVTGI